MYSSCLLFPVAHRCRPASLPLSTPLPARTGTALHGTVLYSRGSSAEAIAPIEAMVHPRHADNAPEDVEEEEEGGEGEEGVKAEGRLIEVVGNR